MPIPNADDARLARPWDDRPAAGALPPLWHRLRRGRRRAGPARVSALRDARHVGSATTGGVPGVAPGDRHLPDPDRPGRPRPSTLRRAPAPGPGGGRVDWIRQAAPLSTAARELLATIERADTWALPRLGAALYRRQHSAGASPASRRPSDGGSGPPTGRAGQPGRRNACLGSKPAQALGTSLAYPPARVSLTRRSDPSVHTYRSCSVDPSVELVQDFRDKERAGELEVNAAFTERVEGLSKVASR